MRKITADLLLELEAAFKCSSASVNALAKRFDVSEPSLRRCVKKHGWVKDAPEAKRRIVADHFAGVTNGLTSDELRQSRDEAAKDAINDMDLGLSGARQILQAAVDSIRLQGVHVTPEGKFELVIEPKDLKTLSECVRINVETIRTIRGLDDPKDSNVVLYVDTGVPDATPA